MTYVRLPQLKLDTPATCTRCHRPLATPLANQREGTPMMGCRSCNANIPTPPDFNVGVEATVSTDMRPAGDWPGCVD